MSEQNFVVEMTLRPVTPEAYKEKGRAEMEYTQEQMERGKLTQLLVTEDHRNYWMIYAVDDAQELQEILNGFPLHDFFEYTIHPVVDIVEAAKRGVTDPNLD